MPSFGLTSDIVTKRAKENKCLICGQERVNGTAYCSKEHKVAWKKYFWPLVYGGTVEKTFNSVDFTGIPVVLAGLS